MQISEPWWKKASHSKPSATFSLVRVEELGGCQMWPSAMIAISYGKQGISMWIIKKEWLAPDS